MVSRMFAWIFLSFAVLAPSSLTAALIAHLEMNGSNGSTTFVDTAGGTWTALGTAQISTARGVSGNASGFFLGDNSSVRNADPSALHPTGPFTIEFWLYVDSLPSGSHQYLAGRSNPDGGQGYDLRLDFGEILVSGVNGWNFNIGTPGPGGTDYVRAGEWGHVALSVTDATAYLFFNGVLRGTSARSPISDGGNAFALGYQSNFGGASFQGYLDDFRFWDTALYTTNFSPPGEIPEPHSWLLVASGLTLAWAWWRWRVGGR